MSTPLSSSLKTPVTAVLVSMIKQFQEWGLTSTNDDSEEDFWDEPDPSRSRPIHQSRLDGPNENQKAQRRKSERHGSLVDVVHVIDDKHELSQRTAWRFDFSFGMRQYSS
jgi:hypothetical protein